MQQLPTCGECRWRPEQQSDWPAWHTSVFFWIDHWLCISTFTLLTRDNLKLFRVGSLYSYHYYCGAGILTNVTRWHDNEGAQWRSLLTILSTDDHPLYNNNKVSRWLDLPQPEQLTGCTQVASQLYEQTKIATIILPETRTVENVVTNSLCWTSGWKCRWPAASVEIRPIHGDSGKLVLWSLTFGYCRRSYRIETGRRYNTIHHSLLSLRRKKNKSVLVRD